MQITKNKSVAVTLHRALGKYFVSLLLLSLMVWAPTVGQAKTRSEALQNPRVSFQANSSLSVTREDSSRAGVAFDLADTQTRLFQLGFTSQIVDEKICAVPGRNSLCPFFSSKVAPNPSLEGLGQLKTVKWFKGFISRSIEVIDQFVEQGTLLDEGEEGSEVEPLLDAAFKEKAPQSSRDRAVIFFSKENRHIRGDESDLTGPTERLKKAALVRRSSASSL